MSGTGISHGMSVHLNFDFSMTVDDNRVKWGAYQ